MCVCVCRRWIRGDGGGAEQWESDVRFLSCPRPQLWSAQICPHKLGETHTHPHTGLGLNSASSVCDNARTSGDE